MQFDTTVKKEKAKKAKTQKIVSFVTDVLPVKGITDSDEGGFVKLKEGYMDILQLGGHNLAGMEQSEIHEIINAYEMLSVLYAYPYKVVSMNIPVNTASQQQFFRKKLEKETDEHKRYCLLTSLSEMEVFNEESNNKEFFVFIYGKSIEELRENRKDFIFYSGQLNIYPIPINKKRVVLFRLANANLLVDNEIPKDTRFKGTSKLEKEGYDIQFFCNIQPVGGIAFKETYTRTGTGYSTSIYVYKLPTEISGFWLKDVFNIPDAIVTKDFSSRESLETLKQLSKAMREQYSRFENERDAYDSTIAYEQFQDLQSLGVSIRKSQQVVKYMTLRIYLYADTLEELQKKIKEAKTVLERNSFKATTLLMEQKEEWQSMYLDSVTQRKLPNKRVGRDVPSSNVGTTFPANHVFLHDDRGKFIGHSLTNGQIIWDSFEVDNVHRLHYNTIILGSMGQGKSTLLKKIMTHWASIGTMIRGFDYVGEYRDVVDYFNGTILTLDGSRGTINVFEVFPTATDDNGDIDDTASYIQHISKLATWYSILKPEAQTEEIDCFENLVGELYIKKGFSEISKYTGRKASEYPILEDLVFLLQEKYMQEEEQFTNIERDSYGKIKITLEKLLNQYGRLFNAHTSIDNVQNEQIVFYDVKGLRSYDSKIVNAQVFIASSSMWSELLQNGEKQKKLVEQGVIRFEDAIKGQLIIDECHNQINAENIRQTKFINTLQREGRKLFVGVTLSTQSINSLAPEAVSSEGAAALKEIFAFSQNRFYFRLPSDSIERLKNLSYGLIRQGQLDRLATYRQGFCLLNIDGGANYEFEVYASKFELELFKGGGRTNELEEEGSE